MVELETNDQLGIGRLPVPGSRRPRPGYRQPHACGLEQDLDRASRSTREQPDPPGL